MAVEVFTDAVEDTSILEREGSVVEAVRLFYIFGLPVDETNGLQQFDDAGGNVLIPQPASVHPQYVQLHLRERQFIPIAPGSMAVVCRYRNLLAHQPPVGFNSTVGGEVFTESIRDQFDINRQPVIVTRGTTAPFEEQWGELEVFVPRRSLTFTRLEATNSPGAIGALYAGRVNSLTWMGGQRNTWLCSGVTFGLERHGDGGLTPPTWDVTYKFIYNPKPRAVDGDNVPESWPDSFAGWQPQVVFVDPETGRPAANLDINDGYRTVHYYEQVDFNLIGL